MRSLPIDISFTITPTYTTKDSSQADRPIGFCVGIGAPRSVIGKKELSRLLHHLGRREKKLKPSMKSFPFADMVFESLGTTILPLGTPSHIEAVPVEMDVVYASVPALLGLDAMDEHSLTPCIVTNSLVKHVVEHGEVLDLRSIKLIRARSNHLFAPLKRPNVPRFSHVQLNKLHRNFFHPSPDKLFNLIKKARPEHVTSETREILKELTAHRDPCQRMKTAPLRFRVSFGAENVRFNKRIIIYIMYLDGDPVHRIVGEGTHFSVAKFLPDISAKTIWQTIINLWATIYTGLPQRILVYQGRSFGEGFVEPCRIGDVEVQHTGIEAHSSLNLGERYHPPLRTVYRKLRSEHPTVDKQLTLALTVKAMNDTLGSNFVVPSTLVFGEHPPVFTRSETPKKPPTLDQPAKIAFEARKKMANHMAKLRVDWALRHAVLAAADVVYERNDEVLIWCEKQVNNRIGEWVGPYRVEDWDPSKKILYVRDLPTGPRRPFNLAQVTKYLRPDVAAQTFVFDVFEGFRRMSHVTDTCKTEVIAPGDPRAESVEMKEAIRKAIKGLMSRGCFKVVKKLQVSRNTNVLLCKYVLVVKYDEKNAQRHKARFVLCGHRDRRKAFLVRTSQIVQPSSIRLLLACLEMNEFHIWSEDAPQTYTQADEPLARLVIIDNVPPEFGLKDDKCLQVVKPVYGLSNSGDYWHSTIDRHHRIDLCMAPLASDQGLFFDMSNRKLSGISGIHVDDLLRNRSNSFQQKCKTTSKKFSTKVKNQLPIEFIGFNIERSSVGLLTVSQNRYLRKLVELPNESDFSEFRSMRMKLGWLANTCPDVLFEIATLAQVTLDHFNSDRKECIKRLNRAVRYAVTHRVPMAIPKLDEKSVRVVGFSDSSFANSRGLLTQLGYIILLVDHHGNSAPMIFKSYKSRCTTRSAMAGVVTAFADVSDAAVTLTKEGERLLDRSVTIQLLTVSKCQFDVISKGSRTSEKRLMLDIAAVREQFRVMDVSDIGLVRSADNLADGLTKSMQQAALREIIRTGKLNMNAVQTIICTPRNGREQATGPMMTLNDADRGEESLQ